MYLSRCLGLDKYRLQILFLYKTIPYEIFLQKRSFEVLIMPIQNFVSDTCALDLPSTKSSDEEHCPRAALFAYFMLL
ncbi:MAG: hypothetical protein ACJASL_000087 [Paraglaciecola sp.]|jgi:hypothetical protein